MRASAKEAGKLRVASQRPILTGSGMRLHDLVEKAGVLESGTNLEEEISSVVYSSRQAVPGSLFVAIQGEKTDGNLYVADAISRGSRAIVSEMPAPATIAAGVQWIRVADARKALA